jgi:hypothetical protein
MDSVVYIATGYGQNGRDVRVRVPIGARFFSFPLFQTGFEAHPASYPMGKGGFLSGGKPVGV